MDQRSDKSYRSLMEERNDCRLLARTQSRQRTGRLDEAAFKREEKDIPVAHNQDIKGSCRLVVRRVSGAPRDHPANRLVRATSTTNEPSLPRVTAQGHDEDENSDITRSDCEIRNCRSHKTTIVKCLRIESRRVTPGSPSEGEERAERSPPSPMTKGKGKEERKRKRRKDKRY